MLNSSYDKIGLNMKFKRAFGLVLENMLGLPTETHYNRHSTTYYHILTTASGWLTKPSDRGVSRFESRYDHIIFFLKATKLFFIDKFC